MDQKKLSDAQLLHLVSQDNRLAFHELFERYWKPLLSSAMKVLNDELAAEDVVQELFIDLWNRRDELDVRNVKGYLYTAIRYQTAKAISRSKFSTDHDEALQLVETYLHPDRALHLEDLRNQIDAVLERLAPRAMEIFVQSRFENLSNKEIAQRHGISIRTVENYLTSALAELRLALGKGASVSTVALVYVLM